MSRYANEAWHLQAHLNQYQLANRNRELSEIEEDFEHMADLADTWKARALAAEKALRLARASAKALDEIAVQLHMALNARAPNHRLLNIAELHAIGRRRVIAERQQAGLQPLSAAEMANLYMLS